MNPNVINPVIHYLFLLLSGFAALASRSLDQKYTLKNILPTVLNSEREPVYGEHVQETLFKALSRQSRFDVSEAAFLKVKEKVKKGVAPIGTPSLDRIQPYRALLSELAQEDIQAILFTEIEPSPDNYRLSFIMVTTREPEIIHSVTVDVANRYSLDSFTEAVERGLEKIIKGIPFDGTILSREGYRVVLDRGFPHLQKGMELKALTIEDQAGELQLVETGTMGVTQVEENLSFGQILIEKRPLEINVGNKFKFSDVPQYAEGLLGEGDRMPSSLSITTPTPAPRPRLGYVNAHLGATFVTLNNLAVNGSGLGIDGELYPGGSLRSELWITRHSFFDFGFQFGMNVIKRAASGTTTNLNSNVNDIRGQVGYRFTLVAPDAGPSLHLKLGLARTQFNIDPSPEALALTSTTYSGLLLGGGAKVPFTDSLGIGFDINTLFFPSVVESPVSSGAETTGISGWDFDVKFYYHINPVLDFEGKLFFQSHSAKFSGTGTRPVAISSSSQTARSFRLGLAYYF